jgi:hypothetical protein
VEAVWTTLKENPTHVKLKTGGKTVTSLTYDNKGRVWQAEEVFEDGNWKRYYGFVGGHRIARAPAAEIEFPPPSDRWKPQDAWAELAPGLYGRLRGWWKEDDLLEGGDPRRAAGEALPIVVELWNARGLEQPIAVDKLLKLRVDFSPETVSRQGLLMPTEKWRAIPARRVIAWKGLPSVLPPGQAVALAAVDLRDGFELSERGYYQVSLGTARLRFSQGPAPHRRAGP